VGIPKGSAVLIAGRPFGFVVFAVDPDKVKPGVFPRFTFAPTVVSPAKILKVFAARYNAKIFHNNRF
jgi:hypothetical protein